MAGLFGTLFGGERKSISSSLDLFREIYGGRMSNSGQAVSWRTALEVVTVLACCRVIAEGVAQVPWKLYQSGASRLEASDHPLFDLLYHQPNGWQTPFEFCETILFHAILTGNAYVWKGKVGSARRLASLEPIEPGRMTVTMHPGRILKYTVRADDGTTVEVRPEDIWHIRGPSWNSWMGMEAVGLARDAIGLSMSTEAAHAEFHRNGARISGAYSVQNTLSLEKFEQLSTWLKRHSNGGDKAGDAVILDNGAKFEPFQMTGVDAQHLETRKHQIEEICRAFRVMPIMVGQADKTATYASAEQMFLAHVVHTLMPWYSRIEKSANVNLLSREERAAGLYTKFNPNALMRGAAKDRADYYAKALGAGGTPAWLTQNEVRELEETAPHADGNGLNPGSMGKQSSTGKTGE